MFFVMGMCFKETTIQPNIHIDLGPFASLSAKVGGKDLSGTQKYPGRLGLAVLWLCVGGGEELLI